MQSTLVCAIMDTNLKLQRTRLQSNRVAVTDGVAREMGLRAPSNVTRNLTYTTSDTSFQIRSSMNHENRWVDKTGQEQSRAHQAKLHISRQCRTEAVVKLTLVDRLVALPQLKERCCRTLPNIAAYACQGVHAWSAL